MVKWWSYQLKTLIAIKSSNYDFLTTTSLIYAIGAGITCILSFQGLLTNVFIMSPFHWSGLG